MAPNRLDQNHGWVLSNPRIHNLYWDNAWSARQPAFTRGRIDAFSAMAVANGYLGGAAQYGVGAPSFGGSHQSSPLCGARRAPATLSAAQVQAWVTCEVATPGTGVPFPGIRVPVSNDVYVVYLPRRTTILDNLTIPAFTIPFVVPPVTIGPFTLFIRRSCDHYGAYHFLSSGLTALFAYAVVPTRCFGALGGVTAAASHELVEAATDPILTAGRIDNSISIAPPGFNRLLRGEAADICSVSGTVIRNGFTFAQYWSNGRNRCVAS